MLKLTSLYKQRGFNIVELMIGILIAAIVVSLAVPSFENTIRRNRTTAEFNRLLGDIAFARSEAIKRAAPVALCPSTDDQTSCSNDDDDVWENGWLVFVDDGAGNNASNRDLDGDETLLRAAESTKGNVTIRTQSFVDRGGILLTADGKLEEGVPGNIGQFVICNDEGVSEAKGITFSPFGQFRQMRDTDADGTIDLGDDGANPTEVACPN